MIAELLFIIGLAGTTILIVIYVLYKRVPKKLKTDKFSEQWKQLQLSCKDRKTWPDALAQAEKLLEKALKRRKYKGKTMGEMMVSAQKIFTDNDGVWFAHNLYKKVVSGDIKRLKEEDIKEALIAYRQALRDLGALQQ